MIRMNRFALMQSASRNPGSVFESKSCPQEPSLPITLVPAYAMDNGQCIWTVVTITNHSIRNDCAI